MNTNTSYESELNKRQIKFNHSANGVVEACPGETAFSMLFPLGAFNLTRSYDSESSCYQYQTDADGLAKLKANCEETVMILSSSVAALGSVLAYADVSEIDQFTLNTYSLLITGLGEVLRKVSQEGGEISDTLIQRSKQK
ncbi:MAG: hypothetical protein ACXWT1_04685 [Methylobacter sp.]